MTLPPGPPRTIPGARILALRRDRIAYLSRVHRQYGDLACVKFGNVRLILVSHPEHIRDILVTHNRSFIKGRGLQRARLLLGNGLLTSEGDFHLRQRRLAQPAFHRQRIAAYAETMVRYTLRTTNRWVDGGEIDMMREMMQLTLAIAAKTLFDYDIESESQAIGDALTSALEMFNFALLPIPDFVFKLPLPQVRRFRRARARLDATIYHIIGERRAEQHDRGDLLSMLMAAKDVEGDGGRMTDEQLRDEVMTILLAGHETTANAMTFTWYLLARHADARARLLNELADVLDGRLPTADDVPKLPYTRMVLAESMRLYPPAWAVGYQALEPFTLDGYEIPARSFILMSQYIVHRDARWFPRPERFDPERWTAEEQAKRPRFSYFPFGGGPRQCIGEQFAWMEQVLLLATIAQRWTPHLITRDEVTPQVLFTLRPKGGMRMRLERGARGEA
ncbi:MAG TPA: cytochrome P450 [Gemmatimonadaceae bacterium]|nr:cytochrome P450 [Gemmatimonadaceae bacterium]